MKFEESMDFLQIPESMQAVLAERYKRNPSRFQREALRAYEGEAPDFPISRQSPLDRLVIWCCLTPEVMAKYREEDVPEEIIRATLGEVSRLALLYERKNGKTGLSREQAIWLRHVWYVSLYQIGSLQFQPFSMVYLDEEGCGDAYMEFTPEQKERLPQGTPVLNVHIPEGAELSEKKLDDSFSKAKAFFSRWKPGAFVCYSWLLYPEMDPLLPEDSNIRRFAKRFQIIGQVSDPYGSDAVRRIYGRRYSRKAEYPTGTSLQKNAIGHFSKLGMACGIIEIT